MLLELYRYPQLEALAVEAERRAKDPWRRAAKVSEAVHRRVLHAFLEAGVSDFHLNETSGYAYDDPGREALDRAFALALEAESALVRPQIITGTQALSHCLFGLLRPGDLLVSLGPPYDTLQPVIGLDLGTRQDLGSLREWGVAYRQLTLPAEGVLSPAELTGLNRTPRVVLLQRSRGYQDRASLTLNRLAALAGQIKATFPRAVLLVDNCYGEFVEEHEPTAAGADLIAGSLIKNLGGSLAASGGYIAGRNELVERIGHRVSAPGSGRGIGPSLGQRRLTFQGLYQAPLLVGEAVKGAIFTAALAAVLGLEASPGLDDPRGDTIQTLYLGSAEALQAFCKGLQAASPVDSHLVPQAAPMPGYHHQVIMAGGTFVQGATSELSADAPLRPPYCLYLQGGISYPYTRLAVLNAMAHMASADCLPPGGPLQPRRSSP